MKKLCKADYDYVIIDEINLLIITDLNYGNMSVTNDIKNVLEDIKQKGIKLSDYKVCYQDSSGCFDGLFVNKETEEFVHFYCIQAKNMDELKNRMT